MVAVQLGPVPTTDEQSPVRQNTAIRQLFSNAQETSGTLTSLQAEFAALEHPRHSVTGDYTVLNADKFVNFGLHGSFFELTFDAVSNYDADFLAIVTNEDADKAKTVTMVGYADSTTFSFILYPLCSEVVYASNGLWFILGGLKRWRINGTQVWYVDPAGDDTVNDGLSSAKPFKSILTAWNTIRDFTDGSASIQLTDGATYTATEGAGAELDGDTFGNYGRLVPIYGDVTLANPPIIDPGGSGPSLVFRDGAWSQMQGIKISGGSSGVILEQDALCDFAFMNWGAIGGGAHIAASDGADCNITGNQTISGAAGSHWTVQSGAKLDVGSVTISGGGSVRDFPNGFVIGNTMARIEFETVTFSGTASFTGPRYSLFRHSVLASNGITPPGDVAGSADATSDFY